MYQFLASYNIYSKIYTVMNKVCIKIQWLLIIERRKKILKSCHLAMTIS